MDEIKALLRKDVEERVVIQNGIQRIRTRQVVQIAIGILIFLMFSANYISLERQNKKQNSIIRALIEVIHQGNVLIKEDSLTHEDTLR